MHKRTQDDQVTSAPSAVNVSIRTAVWMVLVYTDEQNDTFRGENKRTYEDILQYEHQSRVWFCHAREIALFLAHYDRYI